MGFKLLKRNSLLSRICSVAMTSVLVLNLLVGYTPMSKMSYEDVKAAAKASAPQYRNVMYYGEWSIYAGQKNYTPDKIPGNYMTHLNFAFLDVDKDGNVISTDTWADFDNPNVGYSATSGDPWAGVAAAFIQLRNQFPNTKIGFSVGGWTRSGDFPAMAANATTRKNFAENIAKIVHLYGYDFVDIDWEYPTADRDPDPTGNGVNVDKGCKGSEADTKNFTYLMQDLRAALDKYGAMDGKYYELSCAMSASPAMMSKIEYDKVLEVVDFANMMTYDLCGAWAPYTGHQTALYTNPAYDTVNQLDCQFSVDKCVRYLYDTYGNNIDASKIVVGIAPYTRGWAGVQKDGRDPKNPGLFATAEPNSVKAADGTTSGTFAYSDIGTLVSQYGLKEYYDTTAEAAYYYSESTGYFFTCDNSRSVQAKANYVKNITGYKNPFNKPLGGLISWMASLDAASEITKTSHDALYGAGTSLPNQTIEFPAMGNMSTTVTASGADYTITIKNNNTITTPEKQGTFAAGAEANVLYYAEKFAGTATYPVYYIKTKNGAKLSGSAWAAGGTVGTSGDYTTVTMTAWPYYLGPGETATLTLTDPSGTANVSNIAEVAMTKRANASGKEVAWTSLYGNASEAPTSEVNTTKKEETTTKEQSGEQTTTKPGEQTTTKPSGNTGTGSYPAWSPDNVNYALGALVSYNGKVYECTYGHDSNSAWSPTEAPTLWKERPDLVNIESPSSGDGEQETENNYTVNGVLPQHTVTGYWHNFSNGSTNLTLGEVPTYYDLVCVAFTGNTSTPGEATFSVSDDLKKSIGYSDEKFIQDVKTLKARGQHVIISVGGAEGLITINSDEAANRFADSMIGIIEKYGFEGIDIDLEGGAVAGTAYIAGALRKMYNHFGENFIITMAPETAYMNPGGTSWTSSYWNLAISIKDILTTVHTQFYNTGGMNGYGGSVANPGNSSFPANLSTLYIESGLRPDQVAIGVPCCGSAASSGQITPAQAVNAYNAMIYGTSADGFTPPKAYPTFRGLMTWSINWDATQDYAWGKAAKEAIKNTPVVEQPTKPSEQQTTAKPEEPTTKVTFEGQNVALNKTATASGEETADLTKNKAFDGNTDTRWASDRVDNAWIYVDLGKTYALSGVVLNWEAAYGKAYNIQVSTDGNSWTTVKNLTNQDGGIDSVALNGEEARYVKMQGVTRATEYGYSLYEMEVYGTEVAGSTIPGGIEINGYQISSTVKGMRTIYSVDSKINGKDVVASGLVYSLADYASESDMYVGSTSKYVKSYASTSVGVCSKSYSDSDIDTSYAMTMKFATNSAAEYSAQYRIRAYAKLSDGSYVYTPITTYTVYKIADVLYQGCKMNTVAAHNFLYTDILSVVDKNYAVVDYDWNNELVSLY